MRAELKIYVTKEDYKNYLNSGVSEEDTYTYEEYLTAIQEDWDYYLNDIIYDNNCSAEVVGE